MLKDTILAILKVYGDVDMHKVFNLLTIAHELGLVYAGITKWGVHGFYSREMYESLADLRIDGSVKVEQKVFKLSQKVVRFDSKLVSFYKNIRKIEVDPYKIAWYIQAKKLFPKERVMKYITEEDVTKIESVLASTI